MNPRGDLPALLDNLDSLAPRFAASPGWTLFLDFDGTLAPIVPHPDEVCVPEATLVLLQDLVRRSEGAVAIVSGRSIEDVQSRLNVPGLSFAGNHGLEILCPGNPRFIEPMAAASVPVIVEVVNSLKRHLAAIPGMLVEFKGLTASVHVRRVAPTHHDRIAQLVTTCTSAHLDTVEVRTGKHVFEIRPRGDWGKGHAIRWLLAHFQRHETIPIFLGDDLTDEDGFRALGPSAISARVGPFSESYAVYHALGVDEVREFLRWLSHRAHPKPQPA